MNNDFTVCRGQVLRYELVNEWLSDLFFDCPLSAALQELSQWASGLPRTDRELLWFMAIDDVKNALLRFKWGYDSKPESFLKVDTQRAEHRLAHSAARLLDVALSLPASPARQLTPCTCVPR